MQHYRTYTYALPYLLVWEKFTIFLEARLTMSFTSLYRDDQGADSDKGDLVSIRGEESVPLA